MSIPKRIVQTYRDFELYKTASESWIVKNPDYEYRFYDDKACITFFKKFYPNLLDCYLALPNNGQKADFFRYVNVYHFGGFYFDVDTYCKDPLDSYVDLNSNLIIGYEMLPGLYKKGVDEYVEEYSCPKQILQWAFAAEAKSPMLKSLIQVIAHNVTRMRSDVLKYYSQNGRFTLELTGPIAFTSAVDFYMAEVQGRGVQLLPQLNWGYNPWHNRNVDPQENSDVKLIHFYQGGWRSRIPVHIYLDTSAERLRDREFRDYLSLLKGMDRNISKVIVNINDADSCFGSGGLEILADSDEVCFQNVVANQGEPNFLLGIDQLPDEAVVLFLSDQKIIKKAGVRRLIQAFREKPEQLSALLVTTMPDMLRVELEGGFILRANKLKALRSYPIDTDSGLCYESKISWCFQQMGLPINQPENNRYNWEQYLESSQLYPAWYEEKRQLYSGEMGTVCMNKLHKQAAFWAS